MVGFLVVFRLWGPSRWHFFVFLFFCCFIYFILFLLTTKYLLLLFLFFPVFVLFSTILFFLLYFQILFAFSFRKIINFLLVPLVFKFENTFFCSLLLYLFYFISTYNK